MVDCIDVVVSSIEELIHTTSIRRRKIRRGKCSSLLWCRHTRLSCGISDHDDEVRSGTIWNVALQE